jgi:hypothetical protein
MNIYNFDKTQYINTFISKLNNLFNLNNSFKEKLREHNRDCIRQNYTWSVICKKFEDDISNILNDYNKDFLKQNNHWA